MEIQLVYFPFGGRAQAIRDAAKVGNVKMDDKHITFKEWPELKEKTPFGGMPVLNVTQGGVTSQFGESNAILRFIGKLGGLYPQDEVKALACDAILDYVEAIGSSLGPSMHEKDETKKADMRKKLAEETIPPMLAKLKNVLVGPFAVGEELSVADFKVAALLGWFTSGVIDGIPKEIVSEKLLKYKEQVDAKIPK